METRPDDPDAVMRHANKFQGAKALVILGGYSGGKWEKLKNAIKPDVILGANGVNGQVHCLDYWMCMENMKRPHFRARRGDADSKSLMSMFYKQGGRIANFVNHLSWDIVRDKHKSVKARRAGDAVHLHGLPEDFSLREYGLGFMSGWLLRKTEAGALVHVGTVGTHMLHLAGILGCSEVHTIGYDLLFLDGTPRHHWYSHPKYQVDLYRTQEMFILHKGVRTQQVWLESAQFLKEIEWVFDRDKMKWVDHSNGLLTIEELNCTKEALKI